MSKKSLLKVCAFFAVFFFGAAQLPVMAAEPARETGDRDEEVMRNLYAASSTLGVVKAVQLDGNKQITPEQVFRIYTICYDTFPKILARIKRAGLYDEYKSMFLDPESLRRDAKCADARTMSEYKSLAENKTSYLQGKYPRLWKWMNTDAEAQRIAMQMFQKIQAVLE